MAWAWHWIFFFIAMAIWTAVVYGARAAGGTLNIGGSEGRFIGSVIAGAVYAAVTTAVVGFFY